jgi:hypothetical protein
VSVLAFLSSPGDPKKTISPPRSPGARSHVEQPVGFQHDLRIVLDHHERIARVAQALHHLDHAAHVARVQPIEGSSRRRGCSRATCRARREIDALDFARPRACATGGRA